MILRAKIIVSAASEGTRGRHGGEVRAGVHSPMSQMLENTTLRGRRVPKVFVDGIVYIYTPAYAHTQVAPTHASPPSRCVMMRPARPRGKRRGQEACPRKLPAVCIQARDEPGTSMPSLTLDLVLLAVCCGRRSLRGSCRNVVHGIPSAVLRTCRTWYTFVVENAALACPSCDGPVTKALVSGCRCAECDRPLCIVCHDGAASCAASEHDEAECARYCRQCAEGVRRCVRCGGRLCEHCVAETREWGLVCEQ